MSKKLLLYGLISLTVALLIFAGGLSLIFLGAFSVIPRWLISVGILTFILSSQLFYWSIYYFIEYGKSIK